jgi:hypothetical protein
MNEALRVLYRSKWNNLLTAIQPILEDDNLDIKPANPLLLYIDDEEEYKSADIRLMIFGQETNGWYDNHSGTIEAVQDIYDGFFNDGECWEYGKHFWNGVNRFLSSLQTKYPGKKIKLIWNNIIKIGKHGEKGIPPDYIYQIEREYFHVIPEELQILSPNLVLFFTGPNYDGVIEDNFGKTRYEALLYSEEKQLARVFLKNVPFAYRTYHPNYLFRHDIDDYFNTIIDDINL